MDDPDRAPTASWHFVNTMLAHTQMLRPEWGARVRQRPLSRGPDPFDEVVYVVENHDRGWDDYDAKSPASIRRRACLTSWCVRPTPDPRQGPTGAHRIFNEAHDPYCGLLSSMHTVRPLQRPLWPELVRLRARKSTTSIAVANDHRPLIDSMLAYEEARQVAAQVGARGRAGRGKAGSPTAHRFSKLTSSFSFLDTPVALFPPARHAGRARATRPMVHVPMNAEVDTTVGAQEDRRAHLQPHPIPVRARAADHQPAGGRYRHGRSRRIFPPGAFGAALRETAGRTGQTYEPGAGVSGL